jgi:hypothetical protein
MQVYFFDPQSADLVCARAPEDFPAICNLRGYRYWPIEPVFLSGDVYRTTLHPDACVEGYSVIGAGCYHATVIVGRGAIAQPEETCVDRGYTDVATPDEMRRALPVELLDVWRPWFAAQAPSAYAQSIADLDAYWTRRLAASGAHGSVVHVRDRVFRRPGTQLDGRVFAIESAALEPPSWLVTNSPILAARLEPRPMQCATPGGVPALFQAGNADAARYLCLILVRPYEGDTTAPHVTADADARIDDIRVGVEVECLLGRGILERWGAERQSYHSGRILSHSPRYCGPEDLGRWRADADGSLPELRQRTGVEFVSPTFRWPHDLPNLMSGIRAIKAAGATTARACGGHIHLSLPTRMLYGANYMTWAREFSARQTLVTRAAIPLGWRHDHHYALAGLAYCQRCEAYGECRCVEQSIVSATPREKQSRPGAVWCVQTGPVRTHVEVRAWGGSVSPRRWAARIGASIMMLTLPPRDAIDAIADWARAAKRTYRPYADPK